MNEIAKSRARIVAAGVQAVEGELEQDEKGAVVGVRVFGRRGEDLGRLPLADEIDDAVEGHLVGAHEEIRHTLVRPADKMHFGRAAGAEHIQRGARLSLSTQTPAAPGFGIEEEGAFHDALRPRVAVTAIW